MFPVMTLITTFKRGQLPKALAANAAYADLQGIRVPTRQDDGSYKEAKGDVMTHDDMADYFARLRAAQAAAAAEAMEDDDDYEALANIPRGQRLFVRKSQLGGIKKRTKLRQSN